MNIQDIKNDEKMTEEEKNEAILNELSSRWEQDINPKDFYEFLIRFEYVFCIPNDRKDCVFKIATKDLEWSNDYSCFYCYLPDKNVYTKHDKSWDICYECLEDLLNQSLMKVRDKTMTSEQFLEKVEKLHTIHGVPYSEMGKRMGVTGQYISLMANRRKPVTQNILDKASECDMFKSMDSVIFTKEDYMNILKLNKDEQADAAMRLFEKKFSEIGY